MAPKEEEVQLLFTQLILLRNDLYPICLAERLNKRSHSPKSSQASPDIVLQTPGHGAVRALLRLGSAGASFVIRQPPGQVRIVLLFFVLGGELTLKTTAATLHEDFFFLCRNIYYIFK